MSLLLKQACKRLNTRRSKIASEVLDQVKQFFKDADFSHQPQEIRDYANWALRGDGPGFYFEPTPRYCTISKDDPTYIVSFSVLFIILFVNPYSTFQRPKGVFQSTFIINVATKYLRYTSKSRIKPAIDPTLNPPIGLWGLLLLSVRLSLIFSKHPTTINII